MELLNIDLNEIASQAISEKVSSLESQLQSLENIVSTQKKRISELEKEAHGHENVLVLLKTLRHAYSCIKSSAPDESGWYDSKQKNQYNFISAILRMFFAIDQEHKGWYCTRGDGSLCTHLAVNYYTSKNKVCDLLRVLYDESESDINFIMQFRMPYDWSRDKVMAYVKEPKYNTNSTIFGISNFWIEGGAAANNMPHDLIMQSPHILEEDIFGALLTTIKNMRGEYKYLFALPVYNKAITKEQIQQLGRCLLKINPKAWDETIKSFIRKFIKDFCTLTLDYLKQFATSDNQYNTLHWKNFPASHQAIFLKEMPFIEALKAVNDYSCDLKPEEKESLLREILTVS